MRRSGTGGSRSRTSGPQSVDSGLIMMMAQASVMTIIKGNATARPLDVPLHHQPGHRGHQPPRLRPLHDDDGGRAGGRRHGRGGASPGRPGVPLVPELRDRNPDKGTWLGITDQIESFMEVRKISTSRTTTWPCSSPTVSTEDANASPERCTARSGSSRIFAQNADLPVEKALERILDDLRAFTSDQEDDMTIILLKKIPSGRRQEADESGGDGS